MTQGTESLETDEPGTAPVDEPVPSAEPEAVEADPEPPIEATSATDEHSDAAAPAAEPEESAPAIPEPTAAESEPSAPVAEQDTEPAEEIDDVAAAVAAAGAAVADDDSFDSIAPGTVAQDAAGEQQEALVVPATTVSWVPFLVYDLIWLVFAGLLVWQFSELPGTVAVYESEFYSLAVLGGVVLAAAGPLLILAVWIGSWGKEGARKGPLLLSSLMQGSIATLVGVLLWWGALLLLDQLRLGRLI